MVKYLLSNFSTNMVDESRYVAEHRELSEEEFEKLRIDAVAVIRNPAFARLLKVPACSKYITLREGDVALIIGTTGGKLPYNAKSLPEGVSLTFEKVEIKTGVEA